jgi:hypothetical protein
MTIPGAVPPPHAEGRTVDRGDLAGWLGTLLREAIDRGDLSRQANNLR